MLVLGASGWFGRTAIDLLRGTGAPIMAVASKARSVNVDEATIDTVVWNDEAVDDFAPSIVVDCAFLTHDRVSTMPLAEYVSVNRRLIANFLSATRGAHVRKAITISSGAGVYPTDAASRPWEENPYGRLKRETEALLDAATQGSAFSAVAARAWSVSGAYPRNPRAYALGDMIVQAVSGSIEITARTEVWRRYCSADELLAVALAVDTPGMTTIDSGGSLVEMDDLAEAIRATMNPSASISRGPISGPANRYHSDGEQWARACADAGLVALSLNDQIALTARGIGLATSA